MATKITASVTLSEAERRAQRAARFKAEEKGWRAKTKENLGPRVAHAGGVITSNKEEALQRFLERKAQKGAPLDPAHVECAIRKVAEPARAPLQPTQPRSAAAAAAARGGDDDDTHAAQFFKAPVRAVAVAAAAAAERSAAVTTKAGKKNAKRAEKRAQKRAAVLETFGSA